MLKNDKIWTFFWLILVDEKPNLLWLLEDENQKGVCSTQGGCICGM
jgi:hypothetical protein